MQHDGLTRWTVWLFEDADASLPIMFQCFAEDFTHAIEQAEDAYSNGHSFNVFGYSSWDDEEHKPCAHPS